MSKIYLLHETKKNPKAYTQNLGHYSLYNMIAEQHILLYIHRKISIKIQSKVLTMIYF